jgi:hypothetical protein
VFDLPNKVRTDLLRTSRVETKIPTSMSRKPEIGIFPGSLRKFVSESLFFVFAKTVAKIPNVTANIVTQYFLRIPSQT